MNILSKITVSTLILFGTQPIWGGLASILEPVQFNKKENAPVVVAKKEISAKKDYIQVQEKPKKIAPFPYLKRKHNLISSQPTKSLINLKIG